MIPKPSTTDKRQNYGRVTGTLETCKLISEILK